MIVVKKNSRQIIALFALGFFGFFIAAGLTACQKDGNASPTGLNTQLNIVNLSPDILYLEFWVKQQRYGSKTYRYGTPSGYLYLNGLEDQLQLRRERINSTIFDSIPKLQPNTRYSLLINGLFANNSINYIFLTDTSSLPSLGRGKVRFVNTLSRTATVDITANGTIAFRAQAMNKVSGYIEMPAGTYNFRVLSTGTNSILAELPNTTIQDGRLYTLYTRGIVGRTDSAQVAAAIIANR